MSSPLVGSSGANVIFTSSNYGLGKKDNLLVFTRLTGQFDPPAQGSWEFTVCDANRRPILFSTVQALARSGTAPEINKALQKFYEAYGTAYPPNDSEEIKNRQAKLLVRRRG